MKQAHLTNVVSNGKGQHQLSVHSIVTILSGEALLAALVTTTLRRCKARAAAITTGLLSASLIACGGGTSTSSETNTGASVDTQTDAVACDYNDVTYNDQESVTYTSISQWTCSDATRDLEANGIPDHAVGTFPNPANPNTIYEQTVTASLTLDPIETDTATELGGPRGVIAFVLNGVKVDAGTGGSCDDSGQSCSLGDPSGNWSIEALGQTSFDFGTDDNNAHVQPDGTYHYHGVPEGFVSKRGGNSSNITLIGWAADGFPIYSRYGYSDAYDSDSAIVAMQGSYLLVTQVSESRPLIEDYPLGTFRQDWQYVEGSGDLDECNGRLGITPEFPEGIYHYYATDSYPYFQRCVKGVVEAGNMPPPP